MANSNIAPRLFQLQMLGDTSFLENHGPHHPSSLRSGQSVQEDSPSFKMLQDKVILSSLAPSPIVLAGHVPLFSTFSPLQPSPCLALSSPVLPVGIDLALPVPPTALSGPRSPCPNVLLPSPGAETAHLL